MRRAGDRGSGAVCRWKRLGRRRRFREEREREREVKLEEDPARGRNESRREKMEKRMKSPAALTFFLPAAEKPVVISPPSVRDRPPE
jgi:hypothetical protein